MTKVRMEVSEPFEWLPPDELLVFEGTISAVDEAAGDVLLTTDSTLGPFHLTEIKLRPRYLEESVQDLLDGHRINVDGIAHAAGTDQELRFIAVASVEGPTEV